MKIALIGRNSDALKKCMIKRKAKLVTPEEADIILAYGGDGTLLGAERAYPHILKYPIRDVETAPLCHKHSLESQLDAFFAGKLARTRIHRLQANFAGKSLYAMNDIFIHNSNNASALRYKIWIDDEVYSHEIVGDGVGVATVHGSTAYFRSITHSVFRVGIGLAFSNSTELVNHLVLPESSIIKIKINRGPGEIVADNFREPELMNVGDECTIQLSQDASEFIGMDVFMCPVCRRQRHRYRRSIFNPENPQ